MAKGASRLCFFIDARDAGTGGQAGRWAGVAIIDEKIDGVGSGGGCLCLAVPDQKCDFWKVLGLARNPFEKMRLDESFRTVQFSC